MNYVAIMAGGIGSRFWPASTAAHPKQFLDITGTGKSLLRQTFDRFQKIVPAANIYVVTNSRYKPLVQAHLPEISDQQILCEPSRNNTAPCVAYAAFKLAALDPEANMIVAPSDHLIKKEGEFLEYLKKGLAFIDQQDALLTLGIRPTQAHTGYGYIQYQQEVSPGVFTVKQFTEKPPLETAKEYVSAGNYLWNAGIFLWKAKHVLSAFESYTPELYNILSQGDSYWNTPQEQGFLDEYYPQTPNISVDYAIMEQADNVFTIPASFGWSDLGSWGALHQELDKDENQNAGTPLNTLFKDSKDVLVSASYGKKVVVKGLSDYIIVDTEDTLLIYPKSEEQSIKQLRDEVISRFGSNDDT